MQYQIRNCFHHASLSNLVRLITRFASAVFLLSQCLTSEEVETGSLALESQEVIVMIRYIDIVSTRLLPTLKDGVSGAEVMR